MQFAFAFHVPPFVLVRAASPDDEATVAASRASLIEHRVAACRHAVLVNSRAPLSTTT